MLDVNQNKVTVIGLARSGVAAANLLLAQGAQVKISDSKPKEQIVDQLNKIERIDEVAIEAGGHTQDFILASDLIVVSPGVPYDAKPLVWARQKGIPVISEIELAYRLCPCPIIAVTGTNGKTTTVNLIAQILAKAGKKVCLCGNIGKPFSAFVNQLTSDHVVVLEISSFQLQGTQIFRPHIGVWTNFSQNHLDQHRSLEEYYEAKCRLFVNQLPSDVAILNAKQPEHVALAKTLKARVDFFNDELDPVDIDNPNFLAALHAVRAFGVADAVARDVFENFQGVEHRLEFIKTINGVDYINDSKSTTVEAGRWALLRQHKPIILICGGLDKHLDYSPLKDLVHKKVKRLIAIGQARFIMQETFADVVPVELHMDLNQALIAAKAKAVKGDCVLLSPMCASFDMFKNFEERGEVFKEMVNAL